MKRYNEQEMRRIYAKWQESGKSNAAFCKEEGISKSSFYYWLKKFQSSKSPLNKEESGFTPLVLGQNIPIPRTQPVIRINYDSGTSIEFFDTVDAAFIKELCQ